MVNQCQADLVKRLDKIEQDSHLYTHQAVLTIHRDKQLPLGMRALMYTRKTDGLRAMSLTDVFRATIIAKLTYMYMYCSPAWSGLTSAQDRARIDAFLRRSKRCL